MRTATGAMRALLACVRRSVVMTERRTAAEGVFVTSLALCAALALGAHAAAVASVGVPATWSAGTADGWVLYDTIEQGTRGSPYFLLDNGAVRVRYLAQTVSMPPDECVLRAGAAATGGAFAGDYLGAGVQALSFRLKSDHAMALKVYLQNDTARRRWIYDLGVVPAGEWRTVRVPVSPSALRVLNGAQDFATYAADLTSVSWLGLLLVRNPSAAQQTVWVDDVVLEGAGADFAAHMRALAGGQWIAESLAEGDLDGDGMSNYAEWVAGTSAGDHRDFLQASTEPLAGGGVRVRWNAVEGRTYRVFRASAAEGPYLPVGAPVPAAPVETVFDDAASPAPAFYRVKVEAGP